MSTFNFPSGNMISALFELGPMFGYALCQKLSVSECFIFSDFFRSFFELFILIFNCVLRLVLIRNSDDASFGRGHQVGGLPRRLTWGLRK